MTPAEFADKLEDAIYDIVDDDGERGYFAGVVARAYSDGRAVLFTEVEGGTTFRVTIEVIDGIPSVP